MSEFSTRFLLHPLESRDSQHRTRECNCHDWCESRDTESQHRIRERNYYDMSDVRRRSL